MSAPEEIIDIYTPENVAFGYQVAGIGSRFLAAMVDTAFILLLQFAVLAAFIAILSASGGDILVNQLAPWIIAVLGLVAFLFFWGYYIFFEMLWNGQSPGRSEEHTSELQSRV